jgi:uncharacterized protein with beta-barrel porin domain
MNSFIGGAFGYDNTYQNFNTLPASNRSDVFRSAIYGGWAKNNTYFDGHVGYTKNWHQTRRDITFLNATARSKYHDDMLSAGVEFGHRFRFGGTNLTPSIGLHRIHLSSPGVTESGAGDANLHVRSESYDSIRMPVGAKVARSFLSKHVVLTPELRAYYVREFADSSMWAVASFDKVRSVSFLSESGDWGRDSGRFDVGLQASSFADRLHASIDYDYEVYRHTSTSVLGATVGVRW